MMYAQIILAAAKAVGVPGALLLAICTHESKLTNVVVPDDGGSPSYGLCQIKKETAQMVGFSGVGKDLMKPKINARFAALYLKKQLVRYHWNTEKAIAAYNAGSYNPSIIPGKPRNLAYLNKVLAIYRPFKELYE